MRLPVEVVTAGPSVALDLQTACYLVFAVMLAFVGYYDRKMRRGRPDQRCAECLNPKLEDLLRRLESAAAALSDISDDVRAHNSAVDRNWAEIHSQMQIVMRDLDRLRNGKQP